MISTSSTTIRRRRTTAAPHCPSADSTTTRITFSIQNRVRYADYTDTGNMLNANEKLVRRLIVDSMRIGPFSRHVGSSVLTRGEGEAQELQLDVPKGGNDLLRLAESALNDVGRRVRGLDHMCCAEHEQCAQERSRAHEPPPTGWIGTAKL